MLREVHIQKQTGAPPTPDLVGLNTTDECSSSACTRFRDECRATAASELDQLPRSYVVGEQTANMLNCVRYGAASGSREARNSEREGP